MTTTDFSNLTKLQQNQLVNASLILLNTMMDVYGVTEGEQVFNNVSSQFPPGLPEALTFFVLSNISTEIVLIDVSQVTDKVHVIRIIRHYFHKSLREAIDIFNSVFNGKSVAMHVDPLARYGVIKDLMSYGVKLT